MLGLHCCTGFSLVAVSRGHFLVVVHGLLTAVASPVVECGLRLQLLRLQGSVVVVPRLWSTGSIVVVHGPSCSVACGIFLDQGSNPCLPHRQINSLPLSHQGSSCFITLIVLLLASFLLAYILNIKMKSICIFKI